MLCGATLQARNKLLENTAQGENIMQEYLDKPLAALLLITLFLASPPVLAESKCKSLDQKRCLKTSGCTWVKGYTTTKGIKVSSYCRSTAKKKKKGGSNSSKSKKSSKSSNTSKSSKNQAKK
jgi:hypothetical protein